MEALFTRNPMCSLIFTHTYFCIARREYSEEEVEAVTPALETRLKTAEQVRDILDIAARLFS